MKIEELEERMRGHAQITKSAISAPFNLKEEINKSEVKNMVKPKNVTWLKRVATLAAVVTICAITVVSADAIKGYFNDVTRLDGAIVGTEYLDATNEIEMNVTKVEDENVTLNITFKNPNEAPFAYIQEVAVAEYKIVDISKNEILRTSLELENAKKANIENGKISIQLSTDDKLNAGQNYKLIVDNFYGLAKAEQPLRITGTWECEFTTK